MVAKQPPLNGICYKLLFINKNQLTLKCTTPTPIVLKVNYKGILVYEILMDCVARKRMQKMHKDGEWYIGQGRAWYNKNVVGWVIEYRKVRL